MLTYGEFVRLVVSVSIDTIEYVVPFLRVPLVGDLFDIVGVASALYLYGWLGAISTLEFIPGLDPLPINILTWLIWLIIKHQREAAERLLGES